MWLQVEGFGECGLHACSVPDEGATAAQGASPSHDAVRRVSRPTCCQTLLMLRLDDLWVWDSWVADDGDLYHLFFLQAPRALEDPGKRHTAATVGSRHLARPRRLGPTSARPSGPTAVGANGSTTSRSGPARWSTTASSGGCSTPPCPTPGHHVYDQRIGSAVSDDLHHWERGGPEPVVRRRRPLVQDPRQHPGPDRGPGPRGVQRDLARPARLRRPGRRRLAHARHAPAPATRPATTTG